MPTAALTRVERDTRNDSVDVAMDAYRVMASAYLAVRLAVEDGEPGCVLLTLGEDLARALEVWRVCVRRCRAYGVAVHAEPVVATLTGGTR